MITKKYILFAWSLFLSASLISCSDDEPANDGNFNPLTSCMSPQELGGYTTFFKPDQGWVGDPMPYYENGQFYVYYLQDWRTIKTDLHPWHLVTTPDAANYSYQGEMIPCGANGTQDQGIGTGSVIKGSDGKYYAFYTGHNANLDPKEKIMLATSTDLKSWTKDASFSLQASDGYDRNEFRDPFLMKDAASGKYIMLISTRADYKGSWRAVIAQYTSTDLRQWTLETPFYDDPGIFMLECPDVFTIGNYQYLIYSDINDRMVHYVYRSSGSSDWITPSDSKLDGIAFYAGKSASNGTDRYLFGWCPTRQNDDDWGAFDWGGSLVSHRLVQQTNGTLVAEIPQSLDNKFSTNIENEIISRDGTVTKNGTSYTLSGNSWALFPRIDNARKITAKITASADADNFGFTFGACGIQNETYPLHFDLKNKVLKLERIVKNGETKTSQTLTEIALDVPSKRTFDIIIITEKSVCTIYINDTFAFSNRIYQMNRNPWSIFSQSGNVEFQDLTVTGN